MCTVLVRGVASAFSVVKVYLPAFTLLGAKCSASRENYVANCYKGFALSNERVDSLHLKLQRKIVQTLRHFKCFAMHT